MGKYVESNNKMLYDFLFCAIFKYEMKRDTSRAKGWARKEALVKWAFAWVACLIINYFWALWQSELFGT